MKEFVIVVMSTWKFAATFPIAIYGFNMSFYETILYTNIGGLVGLLVFTLASKGIIRFYNSLLRSIFRKKLKHKRIFTKRNRRILEIKNKYGLTGIVLLTHVLLSIPVGAFLITKYFGRKKISYLYVVVIQVFWSFAFTAFYIMVMSFMPL